MSAIADEDSGAADEAPDAEPADASEPGDASEPAEVDTPEPVEAAPAEADAPESPVALSQRRYGFVASVTVMALVLGFVLGAKLLRLLAPRPSEHQCAQLLERYIEHKSRQRYPDVKDEAILRAQRTIPAGTKRADLDSCRRELSEAQVSCGLGAPNIDEMERCLQ